LKAHDYQAEAVGNCWEYMSEMPGNPIIVMPTGTGKSVVIGEICRQAVENFDCRVLVVADRIELVTQNAEAISRMTKLGSVGIYSASAGSRDIDAPIVVGQIQSCHKPAVVASFQRRDLIVIDEAHKVNQDDGMYRSMIDSARIITPDLRIIGTTATPFRMDSGPIYSKDGIFNDIAYELTMREAIEKGWLSRLVTKCGKAATRVDLSGVRIARGDYSTAELSRAMRRGYLVQETVTDLLARAEGRKSGLIFCVDVDHVQAVVTELEGRGESVAFVTGETSPIERMGMVARFRAGEIRWLVNCEVFTTGFNAPNVDCVALMRPTQSACLYVQMGGRGTRLHPGKQDCLVCDYGDLIVTHGPIDLARATKPKGKGKAGTKKCPACACVTHPLMRECPSCGESLMSEKLVSCPSCGGQTSTGLPQCQFCGDDLPGHIARGNETKHSTRASESEIISSGKIFEDTTYQIGEVTYAVHRSRTAGKPDTMRVMYWHAGGNIFGKPVASEFICLNHPADSFPRKKAGDWWRARSWDPVPSSVADGVRKAEAGALAPVSEITLRTWRDKDWPEICRVKLGDKPAVEHDPNEVPVPAVCVPESDDLPF
jgi:DNA repair protein RadD